MAVESVSVGRSILGAESGVFFELAAMGIIFFQKT
jgi:hypothetical protein